MRYIVFSYGVDDIFDYIRSVTLQKVYNPNVDSEENARLAELYGLTVDEEDFFINIVLSLPAMRYLRMLKIIHLVQNRMGLTYWKTH